MLDTYKTQKIGILGAAFDPPHAAHISMALTACKTKIVDKVWLCPSLSRWDKNITTPLDVRVKWLTQILTTLEHKGIKSLLEINLDETSFPTFRGTYVFLKYLQQKYEYHKFFLILGADSWNNLTTWKDPTTQELNGHKLVQEFPCIVFARNELKPDLQIFSAQNILMQQPVILEKFSEDCYTLFPKVPIETLASTNIRKEIVTTKSPKIPFLWPEIENAIIAFYQKT